MRRQLVDGLLADLLQDARFLRVYIDFSRLMFYHQTFQFKALDLAARATEACNFKDWWWKVQLAKCYYRLGMFRDSEKQLKSSLRDQEMVDTYLYLAKVYVRLDQPLTAIEILKKVRCSSKRFSYFLSVKCYYTGGNLN